MSEDGGKVEMVVKCLVEGEQLVAERRCPKKLILDTANSHMGSLTTEEKNLTEVVHMRE